MSEMREHKITQKAVMEEMSKKEYIYKANSKMPWVAQVVECLV
jgi:hypothetical protein